MAPRCRCRTRPKIRSVSAVAIDSTFGPHRGKETGETALFRQLLDSLRPGDVLLADRYYCMAQQRGVHVVFRKHQLRHTDFRRGRRLAAKITSSPGRNPNGPSG